jgi:hypothetical protein
MRYTEFRDAICKELRKNPNGLTWMELKDNLDLPYDRPCQTWIGELKKDIGLIRVKGEGRALVWKVRSNNKNSKSHQLISLLVVFLVISALFGVLSHQNNTQNNLPEMDSEGQIPLLTYEQSYSYIDNKKVRGDTYSRPLTNDTTTLFELDEIAVGTLELEEYGTLRVFDDTYNQLHEIHEDNFTAQNEKGADMVKGNFDLDPSDEIVLSYELDVMENESLVSKTQITFFDDANSGFEMLNTSVFRMTYASLCVGDFDSDGLDEVAMVGNFQGEGFLAGVVFDDLLAEEPILHKWDHENGPWEESPNATREHDIAAGDFDGDGKDEVVTVGRVNDTLITWIWKLNYDPGGSNPIYERMNLIFTLPKINFSKGLASISSGNIDYDSQDELIVTTHDENFKLYFRIHDDLLSDFEILKTEKENITIRTTNSAMGDVDGDGLDEIFVVGHHVANPVGRIYDDFEHDFSVIKVLDIVFEDRWYYWYNLQVDCGDVDGDGIDEYFMFGQSWWQLHGELYDDLSRGANNAMLKRWITGYKLPSSAIGNFDGDGFILEYTGDHESVTTDDNPVVVMAAPPIVEGQGQKEDGSKTRFGMSQSGKNQLSITSELSLSFEGKAIGLSSGVRSALLSEFAKTETQSSLNVQNISFEGNYPHDYVIYQNTKYEIYKYRIISWPGYDDRVGENITINVPLNINLGYKTLDEFDSDDENLKNGTFSHVAGNVLTYPNLPVRNSTLDNYLGWSSEEIPVGQEEGYTNVKITLENENVSEDDLKFGKLIGDFVFMKNDKFTSSTGLSSDMLYEVNADNAPQFEGNVGNFSNARQFKKHGYSYGIYVYVRKNLDMGYDYLVINYWVEGYEGHLESEADGSEGLGNDGIYLLTALAGIMILAVVVLFYFTLGKKKMKKEK